MTFDEMIYPLANASLLITSFALIVDDVWILSVAILDRQDTLVVHYMSIMLVVKYFIILTLTSLLNKPSVANKLLRKMLVMLVLKLKATKQTMVSLPRQNSVLTVKLNSRICRLAVHMLIIRTALPNVVSGQSHAVLAPISSTSCSAGLIVPISTFGLLPSTTPYMGLQSASIGHAWWTLSD
jgi:hypothetical protein